MSSPPRFPPPLSSDRDLPVRPTGRGATPIVPRSSIAGRALVAVVAIMTFLASLTTGAVLLVRAAASEWQSDVAREVTIQLRPGSGRSMESDVARAVAIARGAAGIADVRPHSKEESARLLEPWLGAGAALDDLPIPRMIVVRVAPGGAPDFPALRAALKAELPEASLDDHRGWVERMRTMAGTAVAVGLLALGLMWAATVLSVTFATRGAMATNRPIVEVLHFIGATNAFIARQFQRHFLILGLKGGVIGGGAALLTFVLAGAAHRWYQGTAAGDQLAVLFGTLAIGVEGYVGLIVQIISIALVTAWTSRHTVNQTLQSID